MPTEGQFITHQGYNSEVWTCSQCLSKPRILKSRKSKESPLEREVRRTLTLIGYPFRQEYKLGPYFFDFGFPQLRLLIEADSDAYHHTDKQLANDRHKSELAEKLGWKLVRVRPSKGLTDLLVCVVLERAKEKC